MQTLHMAVVFPYCLINLPQAKVKYGFVHIMWSMITCSSSHATQYTGEFVSVTQICHAIFIPQLIFNC